MPCLKRNAPAADENMPRLKKKYTPNVDEFDIKKDKNFAKFQKDENASFPLCLGEFIEIPKDHASEPEVPKNPWIDAFGDDDEEFILIPENIWEGIQRQHNGIVSLEEFFERVEALGFIGITGEEIPEVFISFIVQFCRSLFRQKINNETIYVLCKYIKWRIGMISLTKHTSEIFIMMVKKTLLKQDCSEYFADVSIPARIFFMDFFPQSVANLSHMFIWSIENNNSFEFLAFHEKYPGTMKKLLNHGSYAIARNLWGAVNRACCIKSATILLTLRPRYSMSYDPSRTKLPHVSREQELDFIKQLDGMYNILKDYVCYNDLLELCLCKSSFRTVAILNKIFYDQIISSMDQISYKKALSETYFLEKIPKALIDLAYKNPFTVKNIIKELFPCAAFQSLPCFVCTVAIAFKKHGKSFVDAFLPDNVDYSRLIGLLPQVKRCPGADVNMCDVYLTYGHRIENKTNIDVLEKMLETNCSGAEEIINVMNSPSIAKLPCRGGGRYFLQIHKANLPHKDKMLLYNYALSLGKMPVFQEIFAAADCVDPQNFDMDGLKFLFRKFHENPKKGKEIKSIAVGQTLERAHKHIHKFVQSMHSFANRYKLACVDEEHLQKMKMLNELKNFIIPNDLFIYLLKNIELGLSYLLGELGWNSTSN